MFISALTPTEESSDTLSRSAVIASAGALLLGLSMTFGSATRFSSVSWSTVWNVGGPHLLGSVILTIALVLFVSFFRSKRWLTRIALRGLSGSYTFLSLMFTWAALNDNHASFVGASAVGMIAVWHLSVSEAIRKVK